MRVLIAGGTGLLGTALTQRLLTEKNEVWILSRSPERIAPAPGLHAAGWDGKTANGWGALVNEMDVLINLAGEGIGDGRWTDERKARILSSRTQAGAAFVAAVAQAAHKPALVLQASGVGAYGPSGDRRLDESAPYGKDFLSGVSAAWEASTQPVEAFGVRRVILRTGLVMSAQGGWMAPLLLPFRWFAGGRLGSGQQWWPWIHIDDYVGAVLHLMGQKNAVGVYNVVAPEPSRMEEFGKVLANVIHRPYAIPTPAFALKLLLGEMSTLILDGQRAVPARLLENGYRYYYPTLLPALENLFR